MRLTIHDPGRIGLRRGIRAAIAMPISLGITLFVIDDAAGAVFAALGTAALLITADFAGTWRKRLSAYVITGIIGVPIILIGWAASHTLVSAVVTTLVVTFGIAFVSLLRGTFAVGAPAVMLVYVVAITVGGSSTSVLSYLAAWWIAVCICTIAALTIVPRDVRAQIRIALSRTLSSGSAAVRAAWVGTPDAAEMTARLGEPPEVGLRTQRHLRRQSVPTLRRNRARPLADAARQSHQQRCAASGSDSRQPTTPSVSTSNQPVRKARGRPRQFTRRPGAIDAEPHVHPVRRGTGRNPRPASHRGGGLGPGEYESRCPTGRDRHGSSRGPPSSDGFAHGRADGRAGSRAGHGAPPEELDHEPPVPAQPWTSVAVANIHLGSPWLRAALRTAIGLSLAVLVVQLTGVEHGFWVMLGVLSVLRYDGAGTRRLVIPAIVGTVAGVLIASAIIYLVGTEAILLWILLPITVFLAAWAPVAISYPVGQAAFSGFILIALGIIVWPPNLEFGIVRIQDILIGIVVALIVGLLMWPRGALGALHAEIASGVRASASYLELALLALTQDVDDRDIARAKLDARAASQRASETYDMAVMQRGGGAADALRWASMATTTHLILAVSRILGLLATVPPILQAAPSTIPAVQSAGRTSSQHWATVAAALADDKEYVPNEHPNPAPAESAMPDPVDVHDEASARGYVAAVWTIDWLNHLDRLAIHD